MSAVGPKTLKLAQSRSAFWTAGFDLACVQIVRDQRNEPMVLHEPEKVLPINSTRCQRTDSLAIYPLPLRPASAEQQQFEFRRAIRLPIRSVFRSRVPSLPHVPPPSRFTIHHRRTGIRFLGCSLSLYRERDNSDLGPRRRCSNLPNFEGHQ